MHDEIDSVRHQRSDPIPLPQTDAAVTTGKDRALALGAPARSCFGTIDTSAVASA